LN
ncbi:hypothetical protein TIFTF001_054631, partial [Ficus carica]|jgi:hypothetical protein